MIRAITLFQPIASLVWEGIKTVETRSYPTKVRGELLIHSAAAKTPESWLARYLEDPVFRFYLFGSHRFDYRDALREIERNVTRFPRGVIGGRVDVTDCKRGPECRQVLGALAWRREKALGDLSAERFGWFLRDAKALEHPFPATGSQGFWDASDFFDITGQQLARP